MGTGNDFLGCCLFHLGAPVFNDTVRAVRSVALAAVTEDDGRVAAEAADLLYHLLVVLEARGIPFAEVEAALERRTATTGLEEKAARPRV